jgi:hypothetical protein
MPLTFPLTLADFLLKLPLSRCPVDLGEAVQADETGGGEMLTSGLGVRLWEGRLAMDGLTYAEAAAARALLHLVRAPGRPFLVTDLRQNGPAADPGGVVLGAATPVLSSVQSGGRELRINGLPAGYVLSAGDYLSFVYGSSPSRQAMHQVVVGGAASGAGLSPWLEAVPEVRAGWAAGAPVELVRPVFRAVFVPGTYEPGESARGVVNGLSIRFSQTMGGT